MALTKCPECGKEISDKAAACPECGYQLKNKRTNSKLFSGLLLNIFSVLIPLGFILIALFLPGSESTSNAASGGVEITVNASSGFDRNTYSLTALVCIIEFILGIIVYVVKNKRIKLNLAIVYCVVSLINFCISFFSCWLYIMLTCGLCVFLVLPGIFQIIAGLKFVSGARVYYDKE